MVDVKKLSIANFNITYGSDCDPMLTHFCDILYPALCSDWKVRSSSNSSYFSDVKLKLINSEYVLTGNLIKETQYNIRTIVVNDELVSSPSSVPTAPYSRFLIFLKSHRMILVKNEGHSPNLKGFQSVLRKVVDHFLYDENKARKNADLDPLPLPLINIINMPLSDSFDEVIRSFEKVSSIKLRFFPLNNDLDPSHLMDHVRCAMSEVDSKTGNLTFNSPKSPGGISKLFRDSVSSGLAEATVKGVKEDGSYVTIKDNQLGSELQIPIGGNLDHGDDDRIVAYCSAQNLLPRASRENRELYERSLDILEKIVSDI